MKKQPFMPFSVRKRVAMWSALLVLFLFAVFLTSVSYLNPSTQGILGFLTRFHFEAMLFVALSGVVIGGLGIYLFSAELQQTTASLKGNTELLLSFLSPKEREIVQLLMEKNGHAFQSDISKMPGMTRLKTHRIVSKLAERKVVNVHDYGKTNIVALSPVILEAFNLNPVQRHTEKKL